MGTVINFEGKDNLSTTVRQTSSTIQSMEEKLDKANRQFEKITTNGKSLKVKLAQLKTVMAEMNLDGLSNTDVFLRMAEQAGAYSDAIGDASQATKQFASDTMSIQASIGAMQGFAAVTSTACGIVGMFGGENESMQRTLQKVQSTLGILNGLQTLSNILNKDSVLVLKMKQIWRTATVKATAQDTVATTVNTTATVANTTATVASTTATKAWNMVKAVSKALLGDWSGLLLVGAMGLATYAIATSDATEKEKEHQDSIKRTRDALNQQSQTISEAIGEAMTKYEMLRQSYLRCANDHEKTQWAEKNKSALQQLGVAWNNLSAIEDAFVRNTDNVVNAIRARARATALQSIYEDEYKKQWTNRSVASGDYRTVYKKGDKIKEEDSEEIYKATGVKAKIANTDRMVEEANKASQRTAQKRKEQTQKENNQRLDSIEKELGKAINESVEADKKANLHPNSVPSSSKGSKSSKTKTPKTDDKKDDKKLTPLEKEIKAFDALEKKGKDVYSLFNKGLIDETQLKSEIDAINQTASEKGYKIKFVPEIEEKRNGDGSITKQVKEKQYKEEETYIDSLKRQLKELETQRDKMFSSEGMFDGSALAKNTEDIKSLTKQIEDYNKKIEIKDYAEGSIKALNEEKSILENELDTLILTQTEKENHLKRIAEINKQINDEERNRSKYEIKEYSDGSLADIQNKISEQQQIIEFHGIESPEYQKAIKKLLELQKEEHKIQVQIDGDLTSPLEKGQEMIGRIGDAVNSLGDSFKGLGTAFEMPELNVAGTIAQGIANMALAYSKASLGTSNPWEWLAFTMAGTTTLISSISAIKSATQFANGGIFEGKSSVGDMNFARVNSGEMILNHSQQGRLFKLLNGEGGFSNNGDISNNNVSFTIRGKDLVGVLNNYNSKVSKVR